MDARWSNQYGLKQREDGMIATGRAVRKQGACVADPQPQAAARVTREDVVEALDQHPRGVERALYVLYQRQTASERAAHVTREDNGVGFNAWDAAFLTDVAERMIEYRRLTPGQRRAVRRALGKYVGQLVRIANGEV
jgi:hypothetical protein